MIFEPQGIQIQRWAEVQDMGVLTLLQVGKACFRPGRYSDKLVMSYFMEHRKIHTSRPVFSFTWKPNTKLRTCSCISYLTHIKKNKKLCPSSFISSLVFIPATLDHIVQTVQKHLLKPIFQMLRSHNLIAIVLVSATKHPVATSKINSSKHHLVINALPSDHIPISSLKSCWRNILNSERLLQIFQAKLKTYSLLIGRLTISFSLEITHICKS